MAFAKARARTLRLSCEEGETDTAEEGMNRFHAKVKVLNPESHIALMCEQAMVYVSIDKTLNF